MLKMDAIKQTFSCRYSIDWKSDLDSYFDIDPVEGTISTNELLDRESIAQHNISIVATKLSEYDNKIDGVSCRWRCPSPAIICVKDLTHFYSSQYSIPFCWKGLLVPINGDGSPGGMYLWDIVSSSKLASTLFSFFTAFFSTFDDIGIGRELFLPESTFTYTVVKCGPFRILQ